MSLIKIHFFINWNGRKHLQINCWWPCILPIQSLWQSHCCVWWIQWRTNYKGQCTPDMDLLVWLLEPRIARIFTLGPTNTKRNQMCITSRFWNSCLVRMCGLICYFILWLRHTLLQKYLVSAREQFLFQNVVNGNLWGSVCRVWGRRPLAWSKNTTDHHVTAEKLTLWVLPAEGT